MFRGMMEFSTFTMRIMKKSYFKTNHNNMKVNRLLIIISISVLNTDFSSEFL